MVAFLFIMSASKESHSRYSEYAAILLAVVLGLLGALNFSGVLVVDAVRSIGVILTCFGIYTLVYLAIRRSGFTRREKNYYLVWGYVPAAIGIALVLTPTVNILFTLSVALIGLALAALLIVKL